MTLLADTTRSVPEEVERIVYDAETIQTRVAELAAQIDRDYRDRVPLVVGILKGAALFHSDLVRRMSIPLTIDFMSVSSFSGGDNVGDESNRAVEVVKDLDEEIEDRDLLVVEDITDTGLSMHFLLERLTSRRPRSLAVCTLLNRPGLRLVELPIRYVGFEVNGEFLVGYGLDFREEFRHLPYVATLRSRSLARDALAGTDHGR